jgi:hypothetical protein
VQAGRRSGGHFPFLAAPELLAPALADVLAR